MLDLFESLPFPVTTLAVAALSVFAVALVARVSPSWFMWVAALVVPFVIAYAIYWAPVWIGHRGNVADHSAWEPIAVGFWGLAGVGGSLVCVYFLHRRRDAKQAHF
jgi:hypothetical protein